MPRHKIKREIVKIYGQDVLLSIEKEGPVLKRIRVKTDWGYQTYLTILKSGGGITYKNITGRNE